MPEEELNQEVPDLVHRMLAEKEDKGERQPTNTRGGKKFKQYFARLPVQVHCTSYKSYVTIKRYET